MNPLDNFEVCLELFWVILGDILGHLGPGNGAVNPLLFYTFWGHLGALLGLSWGHLGAISGHLGPSWGPLGAILGPSWGYLGPSWAILGPSWGYIVAILGDLGPSWAILGYSWVLLNFAF